MIGPELEYYLCERDEGAATGWPPYGQAPGNVYSAGLSGAPDDHLLRTLRHLKELKVGTTAGNREFGSGQFEINLAHSATLDAADRAFRFKAPPTTTSPSARAARTSASAVPWPASNCG
ncbi:hypothetical protein ADL21_26070 [Streptomyces albus subsp. albus]|nr:hypothetical protein ADL21_26070 [Streptomyces albus subsp. albus]